MRSFEVYAAVVFAVVAVIVVAVAAAVVVVVLMKRQVHDECSSEYVVWEPFRSLSRRKWKREGLVSELNWLALKSLISCFLNELCFGERKCLSFPGDSQTVRQCWGQENEGTKRV